MPDGASKLGDAGVRSTVLQCSFVAELWQTHSHCMQGQAMSKTVAALAWSGGASKLG